MSAPRPTVTIAVIGKGQLRHDICRDGVTTKCGRRATLIRESEYGPNCHRCRESRRL